MGFICARCMRDVLDEESYLIALKMRVCRACNNTIENDPDYVKILSTYKKLRNIEGNEGKNRD